MSKKLLYIKLVLVSLILAATIGVVFPSKKYFALREDGIKVEITKSRYISILTMVPETQDLIKEKSFRYWLAVTCAPLIFCCGLFLLMFKGPNVPREVKESLQYTKDTKQNIRENLHGNDSRLL